MMVSSDAADVRDVDAIKQTCCLTNVDLWLDINNKVNDIESRDGIYRVRETPVHFSQLPSHKVHKVHVLIRDDNNNSVKIDNQNQYRQQLCNIN